MTPPGERLRRLSSRVCSDATMRRFVDPAIADLQFERHAAAAHNGRWRASLATLRGVIALMRVLAYCATTPFRDDEGSGLRATLSMAVAIVAMTAASVYGPLHQIPIPIRTRAGDWPLASLLVFQAVPATVPFGIAAGIAVAARAGVTRRIREAAGVFAIVGTIVVTLFDMWLTPVANSAYRNLLAGRPIAPGVSELRVQELVHLQYWLQFHTIVAHSFASVILAAFALSASAVAGGRRSVRAAAIAAALAYLSCYRSFSLLAFKGDLPDALAAWMPNILYATAAALLWAWHRIATRRHVRA